MKSSVLVRSPSNAEGALSLSSWEVVVMVGMVWVTGGLGFGGGFDGGGTEAVDVDAATTREEKGTDVWVFEGPATDAGGVCVWVSSGSSATGVAGVLRWVEESAGFLK